MSGRAQREIVLRRGSDKPELREARAPRKTPGYALVRTLLTGVDGTDEEVVRGAAELPAGEDHLVLGHEALGEVVEAPEGLGLRAGDLVTPLVRRGCGQCNRCLYGASDLCTTGAYREHGIKSLHGFMRDTFWHDPTGLVRVPRALGDLGALAEPLSIAVKAFDEATRLQQRLPWFEEEGGWQGKRALVAGTGSIGSLATLLLRDAGMDVWAMDRGPSDAAPARLVRAVGARHVDATEQDVAEIARGVGGFDLVIEATGAPKIVFQVLPTLDENGVMCMLGVPPEKPPFPVDGDELMRRMVMGNQVLFGSVNSRRAHFEAALERLGAFREQWGDVVDGVITHTFLPEEAQEAFAASGDALVKKAIDWREGARPRRPGG